MLKNRIIPCLDVKNGRVVKGINFVDLVDAGDPAEQAKIYDEQGADELCFLDITASRNILKRSSYKNGGIYISKSKILDELVNLFIERYKGVNSCPLILTNPYFVDRLE